MNKRVSITRKTFDSRKHVKEIRFTCKRCGTVWHVLASGKSSKALFHPTCCCNPADLFSGLSGLRIPGLISGCQRCGSTSVNKRVLYYER